MFATYPVTHQKKKKITWLTKWTEDEGLRCTGLSETAVTGPRSRVLGRRHFLAQSLKFLVVQNLEQNPGGKCFRSKSFRKYQIIQSTWVHVFSVRNSAQHVIT